MSRELGIQCTELAYVEDSASLFASLAEEPWAVFLDSAHPHTRMGRYDIFSARPSVTIETVNGGGTTVQRREGKCHTKEDPLFVLRRELGETMPAYPGAPFFGGALGCFSYDLGRAIEGLPEQKNRDLPVPDMAVGIYDWAVVVDHQVRRACLVAAHRDPHTREIWDSLVEKFSTPVETPIIDSIAGSMRVNFTRQSYAEAFRRIQGYISEGDCYQVNLAQRLEFLASDNDPWPIYLGLRRRNPAPFSAYMRLPDSTILSLSPERFLRISGEHVETRPIKGTRPRSVFAYEDERLASELRCSVKDRAENLMIVDLLRNDLSRVCLPGSVAVPELFSLESYASVHHLVSTVTGRLPKGAHAMDLLRACIPGGSITGAPKRRAMQIIDDLEPHRRSLYCGSMARIGFDGGMDSSIAIRTLLHVGERFYCWGGGGIVKDSRVIDEYAECFHKLAAILEYFKCVALE
ncbi:MAG: aminodeoxychorismate synthase component I [Candidatus Eutrophobiaceae bacterium]